MATAYLDGDRPFYYLKFRDPVTGAQVRRATQVPRDLPNGREIALGIARELEEVATGKLTVRQWADTWIKTREHMADGVNNKAHLRDYILPAIGTHPIAEVRPKDINDIVQYLRAEGKAPRTVRNVYSTMSALFRDAVIADKIEQRDDPCVLTSTQLGPVEDKESGWRDKAVMTRVELRVLLTDPIIPLDRRVCYALLGLAALRDGEMVALQWGDILAGQPLNRLSISKSHEKDRTKTVRERWMPVHPVLQTVLEEWAQAWPGIYGRPFTPTDLVVPTTEPKNRGPRVPGGRMRTNNYVYKRWVRDLGRLGLRHRRIHDLRRTFVSLAKSDGAIENVLKWGTHAAPKHVMALYTTLEWAALCVEVGKLQITLLPVESQERSNDFGDHGNGRKVFFG